MLKRTISSVMSLGSNLNCFLNPVSKKMKKKRKKKDILYNQELTCFTPNKNFQNFYQNKSKINKQATTTTQNLLLNNEYIYCVLLYIISKKINIGWKDLFFMMCQ